MLTSVCDAGAKFSVIIFLLGRPDTEQKVGTAEPAAPRGKQTPWKLLSLPQQRYLKYFQAEIVIDCEGKLLPLIAALSAVSGSGHRYAEEEGGRPGIPDSDRYLHKTVALQGHVLPAHTVVHHTNTTRSLAPTKQMSRVNEWISTVKMCQRIKS